MDGEDMLIAWLDYFLCEHFCDRYHVISRHSFGGRSLEFVEEAY